MEKFVISAFVFLLLLSGGLFGLAKCEREGRLEAERAVAVLENVNAENVKAQEKLQEQQLQLDKAVEAFLKDRKEIETLRRELHSGIAKVLQDNSAARDWAGSGINPDFVRMFNDAAPGCTIPNSGNQTCN